VPAAGRFTRFRSLGGVGRPFGVPVFLAHVAVTVEYGRFAHDKVFRVDVPDKFSLGLELEALTGHYVSEYFAPDDGDVSLDRRFDYGFFPHENRIRFYFAFKLSVDFKAPGHDDLAFALRASADDGVEFAVSGTCVFSEHTFSAPFPKELIGRII
jgi:hypothetical protein